MDMLMDIPRDREVMLVDLTTDDEPAYTLTKKSVDRYTEVHAYMDEDDVTTCVTLSFENRLRDENLELNEALSERGE